MGRVNGLILAAGRGSRMGGLTTERPKCMTEIAGRTLLAWQLAALRRAGIGRVGVVRGYRAEMLGGADDYFDNPRWERTNMAASLMSAEAALRREDHVVSYSDILYHPAHVEALLASTGDIAITYDVDWRGLWEARFDEPLDDAETFIADADGRLLEIGGKAAAIEEIQGQYMGLLRFTPRGFAAAAEVYQGLSPDRRDRLDMTAWLRLLLDSGANVRAVPVRGRWCEVDSGDDLRRYTALLRAGGWTHDWRWDGEAPVGVEG